MRTIRQTIIALLVALSSGVAGSVVAQNNVAELTTLPRDEYFTAGKPVMDLYILGASSLQGPIRVNQDITFLELVAHLLPAGVGSVPAGVKQISTMDVYRSDNQGRRLIYSEDFRSILRGEVPPPSLQHNDMVIFEHIQRQRRLTFRNATTVIAAASSLALLIFRLRDL